MDKKYLSEIINENCEILGLFIILKIYLTEKN